jgi:NAD(P)-dependent dehydrogenase (short-subunit alcohol dehydrogenase family)
MKKIALVTGVSKGIGYTLTKKLLNENFFVIGTSRDGKIKDFVGKDFYGLKLDLSNPLSIENAHKNIFEKFEQINILINNAGIGPDLDTYKPELSSFNTTFNVNVSSKMGSLENCKLTDSLAYRMSKSALNMYTKILANRLKDKIKVAAIHPGWVKTSLTEKNIEKGRLTPRQSAENMFRFIESNFRNGIFWDSENGVELLW